MRLPPLVLLACAMFVSSALDLLFEQGRYEMPYTDVLAIVCVVLFLVIEGFAIAAMRGAGTTMNPMRPEQASRLVTQGIFAYTRNPMYLGLFCALLAYIVYLQNYISYLGLPFFVVLISRLQINLEESALRAEFGEAYEAYCSNVRRWL